MRTTLRTPAFGGALRLKAIPILLMRIGRNASSRSQAHRLNCHTRRGVGHSLMPRVLGCLLERKLSGTIGLRPAARDAGICRAWEALDETGRVADIATPRTAFRSAA